MKFTIQVISAMIFLVAAFSQLSAQEQVSVQLQGNTRLSSYVQEWIEDNALQLRVKNVTATELHYAIEATLTLEGKPVAKNFVYSSRKRTLAAGETTTFATADFLNLNEMKFFGKKQPGRSSTMLVDSGNYALCVNIMDTTGTSYYAKATCFHCNIQTYRTPLPLLPVYNDTVGVNKSITFRWMGVQPFAPKNIRYILRCFPLGDSQYPAQAVRSNTPLLEKEITDLVEYVWQVPDTLRLPPHIVWSVQALSKNNTAYGSSDGYSPLAIAHIVQEMSVKNNTPHASTTPKKRKK